jgi:thioredoxin 1
MRTGLIFCGDAMRPKQTGTTEIFKLGCAIALTVLGCAAWASGLPYDESADAKAEVQQALADAGKDHRPVLLIFGANWCKDCRALDHSLKGEKSAALMAHEFRVVKIDVGNFNRNLDIDEAYGHPIKKGIPAAVLLSPGNQVLYATRAGELADARKMSDDGIYVFFKQAVETAQAPK